MTKIQKAKDETKKGTALVSNGVHANEPGQPTDDISGVHPEASTDDNCACCGFTLYWSWFILPICIAFT